MKRTIEQTYSNKATINTGNYENLSPMYALKQIIEIEDGDIVEKGFEQKEFAEMKRIVDTELQKSISEVKDKEKIEALKNIRFYEKDGKKYPSVTSIISMGEKPDVPNIELYGLRGELLHKMMSMYIKDGTLYTKVDEETKSKLTIIGGIDEHIKCLTYVVEDERAVFDKSEQEVFNDEHLFAGRYDANGNFDKQPSVFDFKTGTPNKERQEEALVQLSAYAKCLRGIKCLVVYPINPKSKQEPIVTNDIDKYFSLFLQKRKAFKDKFGV